MNIADENYLGTAAAILRNGIESEDRTGTGTIRLFGCSAAYDCQEYFPLLTSKRIFWRGVVEELLWFLRGETNSHVLEEKGVNIWRAFANEYGATGPIYSTQWRRWPSITGGYIDQLANVINELRVNPFTRRAVVSAWNPDYLPDPSLTPSQNASVGNQCLPPCHTLFQFAAFPSDGGKPLLSLSMYQRSADWFLGVPFNIASYSLLLHIVAKILKMQPFQFVHFIGDAHIYLNHIDQFEIQMQRHFDDPRPSPSLVLNPEQDWSLSNVKNWQFSDFWLRDYLPHPAIAGEVSV